MASIINATVTSPGGLVTTGDNTNELKIQTGETDAVTVNSSQVVTFNNPIVVAGNNISADNSLGFRNRIINGDMRIDQRNAGAAITGLTGGAYFLDRWTVFQNYGTVTRQQSTTAPTGFVNSFYTTVTSTASVSASSIYAIVQPIEGTNVSDLAFGSASAKTITISFQVRSSVTGTYGVFLRNSAEDRYYASTFSVSSANTWEAKTITVPGDTGGTWLTSNGIGLTVGFVLGAGSNRHGTANTWTASGSGPFTTSSQVDWMSNSGATFYITGVQLEVGSVATPFERRPYGTELALCQRYAWNFSSALSSNGAYLRYCSVRNTNTTGVAGTLIFPVEMRATPTLTTTGTASNYAVTHTGGNTACSSVPAIGGDGSSRFSVNLEANVASGLTSGQGSQLMSNNNQTSYLLFTAEL